MITSLETIQEASQRLKGVVVRTPVLQSAELNRRINGQVFIKPECLQHIGAFKFRGAYNRLSQLSAIERRKGVVAFSSGNHAQGVAYAAKLLGMTSTIVMPTDAPRIKLESTENLGAEIILYDRHTESREQIAADFAEREGATLVPAFDDPAIINGQGTCGLELMEDLIAQGDAPEHLLSPCGGGGLLAGVSTAATELKPDIRVYGVEPEQFDDHFRSKRAGKRVKIDGTSPTLCDALMATTPGELTWAVNSKTVTDFLLVSEEEVQHAVSFAWRYLKLVVEPGGAVALAALLQGKMETDGSKVAVILSGGNIDRDTLCNCLERYPSP